MNIILLGAPGAGKGTQGDILARKAGLPKIATGDLLRAAVTAGTPLGQQAQSYMDRGLLVPDEIILGLIEEKLGSKDAGQGVIMDGFPRTIVQAEAVDGFLASRGDQIDSVVAFEVQDETLIRRMIGRAGDEGRSDDTPDAIRKRLQVYREQTAPLLQFYEERGVMKVVDATGNVDEVAANVAKAIPS
jgi:adenylate kinase